MLHPLAQPPPETSPARKPGKLGKVEGQQAAHRPSAPRTAPSTRRPPPLPVVVLERLVSQQQVPEAVPRRQGQHLRVQVAHPEAGGVRAHAVPAAAVSAAGLPAGTRQRPLSPRPRHDRAPPRPRLPQTPRTGSAETHSLSAPQVPPSTPQPPHPCLPQTTARGVRGEWPGLHLPKYPLHPKLEPGQPHAAPTCTSAPPPPAGSAMHSPPPPCTHCPFPLHLPPLPKTPA